MAHRRGLARRRAAMGFTQEMLAERLGVEFSTVGRWERGLLTPQPWRRRELARALELSLDELVELLGESDVTLARCTVGIEPFSAAVPLTGLTGPAVVASIQATAQAFQLADRRLGGGALLPAVVAYLTSQIGPRLLDPVDSVQGAAMLAAAASMTEITGWMAHDVAKDDLASQYFERAFRLALAADDPALAGNACASRAHLAVELARPQVALDVAEAGLTHARNAPGAARLVARLHAMRARGYALEGDLRRCTAEIAQAESVLADAGSEPPAEWIADFDRASLAGEAALCFLHLAQRKDAERHARLKDAERHARGVLNLRSGDRIRSRSLGQLTLAHVLVAGRRVDEAAALGEQVCAVTPSLTSARVTDRVSHLANSLRPFRTVPEVASFFTRLRQIPETQEGQDPAWPVSPTTKPDSPT